MDSRNKIQCSRDIALSGLAKYTGGLYTPAKMSRSSDIVLFGVGHGYLGTRMVPYMYIGKVQEPSLHYGMLYHNIFKSCFCASICMNLVTALSHISALGHANGHLTARQSSSGTATVYLADATSEATFLGAGFIYGFPDEGTESETRDPR